MSKTALLFGATGLIGSYLLQELLADESWTEIRAFVRKPLTLRHPKLKCVLTDFDHLEAIQDQIKGDALFCCLGTTTRQTPSKEERRKVDYDIPVQLAHLASTNAVPSFMVVSAVGASASSSNFYLRNKGEMERDITAAGIPQIVCMRPSFLMGDRTAVRPGEGVFTSLFRLFSPLLIGNLDKYRPVHGLTVARAMKKMVGQNKGISVLHYSEIRKILADQTPSL